MSHILKNYLKLVWYSLKENLLMNLVFFENTTDFTAMSYEDKKAYWKVKDGRLKQKMKALKD